MFTQEQLKEWGIVDFGITSDSRPISIEPYNQWIKENKHYLFASY